MFLKNFVETSRPKAGLPGLWQWMLADPFRQITSYVNLCLAIKRERESLAKLTDSELQDIGIHRGDVDAEVRRSFFDIPEDRMNVYKCQGEVKGEVKNQTKRSNTVDF